MAGIIKVPFSSDLRSSVQDFHCGESVCALAAAKWIKGHPDETLDCALGAIAGDNTQVWLYRTEEGDLIGFGSIGPTEWRVPTHKSEFKKISVIPWVAVDSRFQHKPENAAKNERFAVLILRDLQAEAEEHRDRDRYLGLCVHRDNVGAIKLYEWFGFGKMTKPYRDRQTGIIYNKMIMELPAPAPLDLKG